MTVSKLGMAKFSHANPSGVSLKPYNSFGLPAVCLPAVLVRIKAMPMCGAWSTTPNWAARPSSSSAAAATSSLTRDMPTVVLKVEVTGRRLVEERADAWIVEAGAGELARHWSTGRWPRAGRGWRTWR